LTEALEEMVATMDKIVYFEHHGIELVKLVYRSMEADKESSTVELILHDTKTWSFPQ